MHKNISKNLQPSSLIFLYALVCIPFFNDFPLLVNISKAFLSISYFIFILLIFLYTLEALQRRSFILNVEYEVFLLIFLLMVYTFVVFFINFSFFDYLDAHQFVLSNIISMIFKYVLLLFSIHYINSIEPKIIIKYIVYGFKFLIIYVIIEVFDIVIPFYILDVEGGYLLPYIDTIFHERLHDIGARSRGFAFEPSYQVVVLMFILPFILHNRKYLYLFFIAIITTLSPTALLAIMYFYIFYTYKGIKLFFMNLIVLLIFIMLFIVYGNSLDFKNMTSSITRIGSWIGAINLISDNFLFGVGPGIGGYWIIFNYPDFFYLSIEANDWVQHGKDSFSAPTFFAVFTFLLDYGIVPILIVILYFFKYNIFSYIYNTPIARASIIGLFISSIGITSYGFLGFMIFFAITITKKWHLFDENEASDLKGNKIEFKNYR